MNGRNWRGRKHTRTFQVEPPRGSPSMGTECGRTFFEREEEEGGEEGERRHNILSGISFGGHRAK